MLFLDSAVRLSVHFVCSLMSSLSACEAREEPGEYQAFTNRCFVLSLMPRTTCQIVTLLLICMIVVAVIACQVHITPFDQGHAMPGKSHASTSAHSGLDFSCMGMAAVLPTIVIFASLLFQVVHTTPLVLKYAVFVFPPFIPPRHTTR